MINFLKKFYKWIIGIFLIAGASAAFVGGLPSDTIYDLPPISISNPTSKSDFQNMSFKKFVKNTTVFQFQERTRKPCQESDKLYIACHTYHRAERKPENASG